MLAVRNHTHIHAVTTSEIVGSKLDDLDFNADFHFFF